MLCIVATVLSCVDSKQLSEDDKEQVRHHVKQMFDDYHLAVATNGLKGEFSFLDSSNDFFWVPPGYNSALDYDSVRSILEQNHAGYNDVSFSWHQLEVYPLSTEIANYSGIVNSTMTDTTGTKFTMQIIESGTVILRKDGWKILSGQSRLLD